MDILTEQMYGEGAIKTIGKVVFWETSQNHEDEKVGKLTAFCGAVFYPPGKIVGEKNPGQHEMWEGEIVFIPKRKWGNFKKMSGPFSGMRPDQILTSNWSAGEKWSKKPYWEKKD